MKKDEFLKKQHIINCFRLELKTLMDKYNIGITETDSYDGEENFDRVQHYFTVDKEPWYNDEIFEIIQDILSNQPHQDSTNTNSNSTRNQ